MSGPLAEVKGNLFDARASAIGHGVNCQGVMGKGIAHEMRRRYPEMYEEYRLTCQQGALRPGGIFPYRAPEYTIINLASQEYPGPDATVRWIKESVDAALHYCQDRGLDSLALPHIGCGVGGLTWRNVRIGIEASAASHPAVRVEIWTP